MRWLAALLLLAAAAAGAQPLRIATGEFPPYATASRGDQGIALAIVRRAFALGGGHQVEFHFLPWSRAQLETQQGRWDASAHWGASAERRANFLLSDNLLTEHWVFVHRRDQPLHWNQLDDLHGKVLGLTRDYTYTPALWAAVKDGRLRSEPVPNDAAGLRMLRAGRIDVLPLERSVACDLLARQFKPGEAAELAAHPKPLNDQFSTHVIFPKQLARSAELLADFNRGLKRMREAGEYQALRGAVPCPAGW